MSRPPTSNDGGLRALFERARALPRQPDDVRARALARARAAAAAPLPAGSEEAPRRRFPRTVVLRALVAALATGVVGSVFALGGRWSRAPSTPATPSVNTSAARATTGAPPVVVASSLASVSVAPPGVPTLEGSNHGRGNHAAPPPPTHDAEQASYGAELELMRSAHVAYARHDFTSALLLAGEHARRFPGGLLTEEREALRVRSLLGAGRLAEARRAAAAFASRFPRSVLAHRLEAEVGTNGD